MEQACVFHSQKSIYLTTKINKIINREILQTLFFKGSFHFVEKGDLRVRPGRCKAGGDVGRGGGCEGGDVGGGGMDKEMGGIERMQRDGEYLT